MQFVANGPDIPDALLQSHEEGRVVFFCGAGISYPAGLPGFKGLVDAIYAGVGTTRSDSEEEAYQRSQFDATLDLLERRLPGQRLAVRTALSKALQPRLRRRGATDTHSALLQLARGRDDCYRLVTTNFDRIFSTVMSRTGPKVAVYAAPFLPVAKNSRWNGLVYLHGVLPETFDEGALNRLVLTSGDFGLAYLTERWASRFVGELFRNYVVCFVGYSINDPVLRYMMDALAADRLLGEITPQAYSFADCPPGLENSKTIEWEAKGVVPILYELPATRDHSSLHRTVKKWAETHRDGVLGKERIALEYAIARPSSSTRQDDFVGRMLWALSDRSGLPAKRFAEFNPVPALDWLESFSKVRYGHGDLARFGVPPHMKVDEKLGFSLVNRPAPYALAPWMALVSDASGSGWDDVMFHLAQWLLRHLDDPALVLWLAQKGGRLHERLIRLIENRLEELSKLQRDGNADELARIRAEAPSAIPRPLLQIAWHLLLVGRVKAPWHELDLYGWKNRLDRYGLTSSSRFELRSLLAPKITLREHIRSSQHNSNVGTARRLRQLIDWELVLAADHVHFSVAELAKTDEWIGVLPTLFEDFQQLLRDALGLLKELGEADDNNDRSHWDLPSITQHQQNRGFRDWTVLIELLRDAWLAVREADRTRAAGLAASWFSLPYSTFKRLALFAASHGDLSSDLWVDWLVTDGARWLWSIDTRRETLRLLVLQGLQLTPTAQVLLETAILAGPPRSMYREDMEPVQFENSVDREVFLYLAKLASSSLVLRPDSSRRLSDLSAAHPAWKLASNERDEFTHWTGGTGDPDYEDRREVTVAPRSRAALVTWLRQPRPDGAFYEDNWRDTCRSRFFHCALALCDLAQAGEWPAGRWREALQVWSEEAWTRRSWRFVGPSIRTMPSETLREIADSIARWLEAVSKSLDHHQDAFLEVCRRILELPYPDEPDPDDLVTHAINHPVGHVAEAFLSLLFQREPNDNEGLPPELKPLFTQLCDTALTQFRNGRVVLASRLIAMFRVDRGWTESHLLPLFEWRTSVFEARAAWEAFLWSPRLYGPLLLAFKEQFLESANHYAQLGRHGQQFAAFVTYAALAPEDSYTAEDFQMAFSALPQEGLTESAQTLVHALEAAGEQREDYWVNRIQPFWQQVWPKNLKLASKGIAERLARLTIAAGGKFPSALATVQDWLRPIEHLHFVVHRLHESGLAGRFPKAALRLLHAVVNDQSWAPRELGLCLAAISQAAPDLRQDRRFQLLEAYFRRRGI